MKRNQGDGDYDSRHRQRHFGTLVRRGVGFTDLFSPWQCSSGKAWHCSSGFSKTFHFADGTDTETEYEYDENGNMVKDLNYSIKREKRMLAYSSEREKNRYKINRNISSIQYNSLNLTQSKIGGTSEILKNFWHFIRFALSLTQSKIGGTSEILKNFWHFIRFALSLSSMIQFGDNSYIEYTYRASGEKLRVTYGVRQQPVLSPAGAGTSPSHSFIVVRNEEGTNYYAFGSDSPHGLGGNLVRASYTQDKKIFANYFNDVQNSNLKNVFEIPTPDGVTEKDFDNRVIDIAESFYEGSNNQMNYALDPGYSNDQGNCNTSTSTILFKAGIGKNELMKMKDEMKGLTWGFGKIRPWTKEEQEKAAQENEGEKDIIECYQKEGW